MERNSSQAGKLLVGTSYEFEYLENVFSNEEYEFALKEHPANIVKTNLYSKINSLTFLSVS